jgi:NCS1 family nucleobase:cation symporter-1
MWPSTRASHEPPEEGTETDRGEPMSSSNPSRHPESDRPWSIETHGIDPIGDAERHGKPADLFWIWFAANISVLAVTYGGFLVIFYRLNLWQAVAAALAGVVLSFLLVGFISLAGKRGGAPTLVLSRAAFGVTGNTLPVIVSYVTLVGFEIVATALATLAVRTVFGRLGAGTGNLTLALAFVIIAGLAIAISLLGHATIQRVQAWFTVAFGILTVVFIGLELPQVDWHKVASLPAGSLLAGLLGGFTVIMAGTGITWTNAAADYSRYLPRSSRSPSVVWWTVAGGSLPLVVLIIFGALLAAAHPAVATSSDPIGVLAGPLPTWFLVPYLLAAVGGLVAEVVMSSYSGGLNLLTLGLRVPRYKSIIVDSVLLIAGCVYILFFAPSFFAPFQGFLFTVGVPLAAWAAIFLADLWLLRAPGYAVADLYRNRGRYGAVNIAGVGSLIAATALGWGLVTSTSPVFSWAGYLLPFAGGRTGPIGGSSIGLVLAFLVAGLLYSVATVVQRTARSRQPQAAPPTSQHR